MPYIGNIVQDFSVNTAMLNSDSVTSIKIADGTIVNADINASAAIDVSKLSGVLPLAGGTLTGDLTIPEKLIHSGDTDTFLEFLTNTICFDTAGSERMRINSSGNVGIGTASPSTKFEVQTAASERIQFLSNGSNEQPRIDLIRDSGTDYSIINAIAAYEIRKGSNLVYTYANDTHRFSIDGSEKARIDSSGNVGIGTTTPQSELVVRGSTPQFTLEPTADTQTCRLQFCTTDGTIKTAIQAGGSLDSALKVVQASAEVLRISSGKVGIGTTSPNYLIHQHISDSGANYHQFTNSTTGSGASQGVIVGISGTEEGIIYNRESTAIRFGTANTERMRIASDGDVGIGTNSPSGKLHLSSGTSGDCELIIESDTDNNNENDNPRIIFKQDGGSEQAAIEQLNNRLEISNSVSSNGGIVFKTGTSSPYTNATERMRIAQDGDVGIGTTSPDRKLHVAGSFIRVDDGYGLDTSGATERVTLDQGVVSFTVNSSERMRINSSGHVGIGTTSPTAALEVIDGDSGRSYNVTSSTEFVVERNGNCFMAILGTNTANTVINFGDAADENAGAIDYDHNDDAMRFRVNAANRMKISSNGAIGAPSGSNIHSVSDSRLKKNVVTLDKGLSAINSLRPVSFNWIDGYLEEEKNTLYGFIAQEVESVDNNLIQLFSSSSVTVGEQTIDNPLTVNEKFIIPMLVKAVQELSAKVTALEAA